MPDTDIPLNIMSRCSPYVSIPIDELTYNLYIPIDELTHNLRGKASEYPYTITKTSGLNESSAIVIGWPFVSYTKCTYTFAR